ncbi:MAG: DUF1573 domain-containing protein [Clostridia bacterium]|nr:DUF1573 domain-containing protein [Clostridia bacterium]
MKKTLTQDFQDTVSKFHIWNKSILDIMSKLQSASSKINRAAVKSVTGCGCVEIDGRKSTVSFEKQENSCQMRGDLCDECRANMEREIGEGFYYMVCMCNALNLNLDKIIQKETDRVKTLGKYNLM